jgi:hypothetical protein
MTKTELMLLAMTDGRPTLSLAEIANLLGITEPSAKNKIYSEDLPFHVFQVGTKWCAHVSDVAKYIDDQRAEAKKTPITA